MRPVEPMRSAAAGGPAQDGGPESLRAELPGALAAAGLSLAVSSATAWTSGVPLDTMGVYFDGYLYTEIARSFPLPFAPDAKLYAGQAPGYPALIALVRALVPAGWLNWAEAALVTSWLAAAAAAAAFHLACRAWGIRSVWPTVLFVVANPGWVRMASFSNPESVAMLFAVAALLAYARSRVAWTGVLLTLATLSRFQALLLVAPVAYGFLVTRRRRDVRTLLWLAAPLLALALLHLYLRWRIPGFTTVWEAHQPFWRTEPTWPFTEFLRRGVPDPGSLRELSVQVVLYGNLALHLLALCTGLRPGERERLILPLWIAAAIAVPLSLSGRWAVNAFVRLSILAWPATVLVAGRALGDRLPRALWIPVALASTAFAVESRGDLMRRAVLMQQRKPAIESAIRRVDQDEPVWFQKRPPSELRGHPSS